MLSTGLIASLEKNVVDYALMSLQRAGPIRQEKSYRVRSSPHVSPPPQYNVMAGGR